METIDISQIIKLVHSANFSVRFAYFWEKTENRPDWAVKLIKSSIYNQLSLLVGLTIRR